MTVKNQGNRKQVSRLWVRFLELGAWGCLWQKHLDGEAESPGESTFFLCCRPPQADVTLQLLWQGGCGLRQQRC